MNVIFIYSLYGPQGTQSLVRPIHSLQWICFGISYISSFLKNYGHQTRLIVLSRVSGRKNKNIIDEYFKRFYPKLICFTAVNSEYRFIADIAEYVKSRYPDIYLLIGGSHVSLVPEEVIQDDFDALCIGEGENSTLELVTQLQRGIPPSGISNLWIKYNSEIEKNLPRPFLQDLDSLPPPDREMWQEWIKEQTPTVCSVLLGRGCPYQCTYCSNHALKKIASGNYVRFRSTAHIINEIEEITNRYPALKEIFLEVETFGINEEWAVDLCLKLASFNKTLKYPLSFGTNLRITPGINLERIFMACKESNFRFINIGVESGSERVRREILKRDYSNQDIINSTTLARKHSLLVSFFNMIGIPGETISDFQETVKINRICLPDWHGTSIFFPYQGTELYFLCKNQGLLKRRVDTRMERSKAILDLPGFSRRQIQKSYVWFDYLIYRGYKPKYELLEKVYTLKLTLLLDKLSLLPLKYNYFVKKFYYICKRFVIKFFEIVETVDKGFTPVFTNRNNHRDPS